LIAIEEKLQTKNEGEKKKPEKIKCEKCRRQEISPECRNPDIKVENFTASATLITTSASIPK
jgi:hypothetical protein